MSRADPPATAPGSSVVELDAKGRLQSVLVVPSSDAMAGASSGATPDWSPYFRAAGLSIDDFTAASVETAPPIHADHVAAWTGTYPGQPEPPLRIEAGAREGRVLFWRARPLAEGEDESIFTSLPTIAFVAFALMWIGAGFLAHRHLKSGSGDRHGALRLGAFTATIAFVGPLLFAHHTAAADEFFLVFAALAQGTMIGAIAWLLYMALEPYARRTVPRWIVSWARLLEGRWKDPMVGRDVLCGLAATAAVTAVAQGIVMLGLQSAAPIEWSFPHGMAPLRGALATIANVLHPVSLLLPFGVMAVLVASRALIRNEWLAIATAFALVAGFDVVFNGADLQGLMFAALLVGAGARWGLLAMVAGAIFAVNLRLVPVSADPTVWWASTSWLGWGVTVALALYGYRIATVRPATGRGAAV